MLKYETEFQNYFYFRVYEYKIGVVMLSNKIITTTTNY